MHPRNVYAQEYVTRNNDGEAPTNWNDEHARCLYTQKLLFRDFGVTCKVTAVSYTHLTLPTNREV